MKPKTLCLALLTGLAAPLLSLLWLPVRAEGPDAGEERLKIRVMAERFHFTPSEIRVEEGQVVEIELTSEDTFHGFRIPSLGLDVTIPARGRGSVSVLFNAARKGRYAFECSRPCGAGHTMMRGVIIVH